MNRRISIIATITAVVFLAVGVPAHAAPYYQGKVLRIMVGFFGGRRL